MAIENEGEAAQYLTPNQTTTVAKPSESHLTGTTESTFKKGQRVQFDRRDMSPFCFGNGRISFVIPYARPYQYSVALDVPLLLQGPASIVETGKYIVKDIDVLESQLIGWSETEK